MGYAGYGNNSGQPGIEPGKPEGKPQAGKADEDRKDPGGAEPPAAGPHADPALVNPDATPGAGTLPPPGAEEGLDSTSG